MKSSVCPAARAGNLRELPLAHFSLDTETEGLSFRAKSGIVIPSEVEESLSPVIPSAAEESLLFMRFLRFVRFAHFGRNDKGGCLLSFRPPKGGVNPLGRCWTRGYTRATPSV